MPFEEILDNVFTLGDSRLLLGKHISLLKLSDKGDYVFGIVSTSKVKNVPPGHDWVKGSFRSLDLDRTEGLAYANAFIYDKRLRLLMYEYNRSGCYINTFMEYIRLICRDLDGMHGINPVPSILLTPDAYERIMRFRDIKSINIKVAAPQGIIDRAAIRNSSLHEVLGTASVLDSDTINLTYSASGRGGFLNNQRSKSFIDRILNGRLRESVEKLEITGIEPDPSDDSVTRTSSLDIITSRMKFNFNLPDIRLHNGLQVDDRYQGMTSIYRDNLDIFRHILLTSRTR